MKERVLTTVLIYVSSPLILCESWFRAVNGTSRSAFNKWTGWHPSADQCPFWVSDLTCTVSIFGSLREIYAAIIGKDIGTETYVCIQPSVYEVPTRPLYTVFNKKTKTRYKLKRKQVFPRNDRKQRLTMSGLVRKIPNFRRTMCPTT